MKKAFSEIYRTLKAGGMCVVACETCNPDIGWPDPYGQITIYRPEEPEGIMAAAHFVSVGYERTRDDMLCVRGYKQQ